MKQCLKIRNGFVVLPDVWTLTKYFVFIGDELTVARDVLSSGWLLVSNSGEVTVESGGQESPGCPYWRA